MQRLHELGDYIRRSYGRNLLQEAQLEAGLAAEGHPLESIRQDDDSCYIPAQEDGMAEIVIRWNTEQQIRRVVLKEQIRLSQRVEAFAIDAWTDGGWKQAAAYTVIGYKRIAVLEPIRTNALRIRILDARVAPTLKFIGVYE